MEVLGMAFDLNVFRGRRIKMDRRLNCNIRRSADVHVSAQLDRKRASLRVHQFNPGAGKRNPARQENITGRFGTDRSTDDVQVAPSLTEFQVPTQAKSAYMIEIRKVNIPLDVEPVSCVLTERDPGAQNGVIARRMEPDTIAKINVTCGTDVEAFSTEKGANANFRVEGGHHQRASHRYRTRQRSCSCIY